MKQVRWFSWLFVFIVTIIVSCDNDNPRVEYEYYDTGEIYREILYQNAIDTTSFTVSQYYKNGTLHAITSFLNGKRNGMYKSYYENGSFKESADFKNGKKQGIVRLFNIEGKLKEESLYITDKLIMVKRFFENPDLNLLKMECYMNNDSILSQIGVIVYNSEIGCVKEKASFFYEVLGQDTIEIGAKGDYITKFYNKRDDFLFQLKIGEMNSNLEFSDSSEIQEFNTMDDSIKFYITPTSLGNNLLLGMIYLEKDTIQLAFPFYKEFYVIE